MSRLTDVFRLEAGGVLIAYLMGGDPSPEICEEAVGAAVRGGADIVELGIPFSDPIADGRTIQAAGTRALSGGTNPGTVLRIAKRAKKRFGVPIALMTYLNPVNAMGAAVFLERAKGSGVHGVIIPDLPVDEAGDFGAEARRRGVDSILLAAPSTTEKRMRMIAQSASGFVYLVSVLGVTGARARLDRFVPRLIARSRRTLGPEIPLAVGFGISRPEHVRQVLESGADGAIVGSALVEKVAANLGNERAMIAEVERYVGKMKAAASSVR
ncbi:MAG: tryptophan synthase subunit alpha [Nitrososphaerota archaeon]|nr:tryptophan synthase subunit alpha [Nitrososphaerota archaeon]